MTIRTTAARLRPSLESAICVLVHTMTMTARPCQSGMSTVGTTGDCRDCRHRTAWIDSVARLRTQACVAGMI